MADIGNEYRFIHLREISADFIKRRPTSVLKLVFKDHATGVKHCHEFKKGDPIHWNIDTYVTTRTSATLAIRRTLFKITVAEIEIEIKPNVLGDSSAVTLDDSSHRVNVNFVCGRSQSLADVALVLQVSSQGWANITPLVSKLLRFLKLPQLSARLPPKYKRGYAVLYTAIHWLNDDILLSVFNCYRLDDTLSWADRLGWRKLSQVCQRWRRLMYNSALHLGISIKCTNGTGPIVDRLDHLAPLPLQIDYDTETMEEEDELGIYHVLRLHDRVRHIHLYLPPPTLHKCLALMDKKFPILEHLSLLFMGHELTTLALPEAFLAPNLRLLTLPGICPPKRLRLLTSAVSLVTLTLKNIQACSYFGPNLLVARLSSLTQLEKLSIKFSIPISRPSAERELLNKERIPITIPRLKSLEFLGVSAYLESLIAQIRVPLLERLHVTFFDEIAIASPRPCPHLSHLINITEGFRLPSASIYMSRDEVFLTMSSHSLGLFGPFRLGVECKQLGWHIGCVAQICNALIPTLSDVQELSIRLPIRFHDGVTPLEGNIEGATWYELLRSFRGVKVIFIDEMLFAKLSRLLRVDEIGSQPGFLPNLQYVSISDHVFSSFMETYRVVRHPTRLLGPFPGPPLDDI